MQLKKAVDSWALRLSASTSHLHDRSLAMRLHHLGEAAGGINHRMPASRFKLTGVHNQLATDPLPEWSTADRHQTQADDVGRDMNKTGTTALSQAQHRE